MAITAVQKEIIKSVAAEENLGGWAFGELENLVEAGTVKIEKRRDARSWMQEQRALGRSHLFNGPPVERKEEKPTDNPFHPSTYNLSAQGRLMRVSPELAANLCAKIGPGSFIGQTLEQAKAAAARKAALKE